MKNDIGNIVKIEANKQLGSQIATLETNAKRANAVANQFCEVFELNPKTYRYDNNRVTIEVLGDSFTIEANLSGVFFKLNLQEDSIEKIDCFNAKSVDWSRWDDVYKNGDDAARQLILQAGLIGQLERFNFTVTKVEQIQGGYFVDLKSANLNDNKSLKKSVALIVSYLKSRDSIMKFDVAG